MTDVKNKTIYYVCVIKLSTYTDLLMIYNFV